MSRWEPYNPNPAGARVGDCTVRAISKATGRTWASTYLWLCVYGLMLSDMPNADHVWGAYLRRRGFVRHLVDDRGQDTYTVTDFCEDHPEGLFVLAPSGHVVCVQDGIYFDSWDSGEAVPVYYWECPTCKGG